MQQTVVAVKSQQKGTDHALASGVTKATYNTISCADLFYLHRSGAFAGSVLGVETFRDYTIKVASGFSKPIACNPVISSGRGKAYISCGSQIRTCKSFEKLATLAQSLFQIRPLILTE